MIDIRTAEGPVVTLKSSWTGNQASGWMFIGDWENWMHYRNKEEWRRAERHRVGYVEKAKALLDGRTWDEAELIGGAAYSAMKTGQSEADRALTLENLKKQAIEAAAKNHVGELLTATGPIVAMFPGYGTLIGTGMMIGGTMLTAAQKTQLMRKAADMRYEDLRRARERFLAGDISEEEYLRLQTEILQEVGGELWSQYGEDLGALLARPDQGFFGNVWAGVKDVFSDPASATVSLGIGVLASAGFYLAAKKMF